ncbi:MAG TPA: cation transporter [Methanomicrobiales archaeon]|nr:cation transporter [Methanomicrobiales archaeon]
MASPAPTLHQTALHLEYFTVGYNIVEAVASIVFGNLAGSIALIGFGLDSIVESLSGLVLIWRLRRHGHISRDEEERVERRAQRFVALTFFILGAYVLYESGAKLIFREAAQPSSAGIIIALLSILIMPMLAWRKQQVGMGIGSRALIADSKETLACAFLSVGLLAGLGANQLFGFWQADPLAGLFISLFLFREGYEGWRESGDEKADQD